MPSKEYKLSKQAGAGTTDITLSIPETIQIIWRAGSATIKSVIMAP